MTLMEDQRREPADPTLEPVDVPSIAHLSFDERLQSLLELTASAARASGGAAWLTERGSGDLVARAWVPAPDPPDQELRCRVGNGAVGAVVRDGRAAIVREISGESLLDRQLRRRQARAVLILPLLAGGRAIGAVHLEYADPQTLDLIDRPRVVQAADHLGAVVEAAWLSAETNARNEELERKNAEFRELDRLKGDFLSMVSHELRTPLTAIIGYTDLLLREVHGSLNERQRQHQQAVKKAAHRLLALINDLLDVTRLESGSVELAPGPVPLAQAFERIIGEIQPAAAQRDIELRLDVPTRLPAVLADADRLHQILFNLLDNAIKFTPPSGTVTLRAERQADAAHICVVDTGNGVPREQLERIWDRFHQVDSSTRRRYGGTGLGLAIVRNLVQLHNGTVSAQSPGSGRGSSFCFSLPVIDASDVEPSGATPPPDAVASPTGRRRILIVDDEPDNREVIASVIGDLLGHQPLLAEDGEQALEAARELPDLILLDLRLPDLSGFEIARRLKADPRTASIPIVAITAMSDPGDRDAAIDAGCVGHVTKPFTDEALTSAISHALQAEQLGARGRG